MTDTIHQCDQYVAADGQRLRCGLTMGHAPPHKAVAPHGLNYTWTTPQQDDHDLPPT